MAIYASGAAALVLVVVGVVLFARDHASPKPVLGGAQTTTGALELAAGEGSPVVTNPAPVGRSVPGTVEPAGQAAPAAARTYVMPTASRAAAPVPAPSATAAAPEPTELPLPGGPVITRPHGSAETRSVQSPPAGDTQPAPRPDTTSRPTPAPAERPDTAAPSRSRPDTTTRPTRPDTTALK